MARESRPLGPGERTRDIKTHPDASHIVCSLQAGDQAVDGIQFAVECGREIEPLSRHFIVFGAMKAGTTTLFNLLTQHPAICRSYAESPGISSTKEINYFRKLYRKSDSALHYDWRFPFDPARHTWTLDVSPGYAKWPGSKAVPARIASLDGDTKLAYILREPVDRIESHLAHSLQHGRENKNLKHCIRTSRYAMQLDKFTEYFARDNILLLDFEELQRDPGAILAQVCDFLHIDHIAAKSDIHNTRGIDFQLDASQRAEFAESLRPDVQRLINLYGFSPAKSWLQSAT